MCAKYRSINKNLILVKEDTPLPLTKTKSRTVSKSVSLTKNEDKIKKLNCMEDTNDQNQENEKELPSETNSNVAAENRPHVANLYRNAST